MKKETSRLFGEQKTKSISNLLFIFAAVAFFASCKKAQKFETNAKPADKANPTTQPVEVLKQNQPNAEPYSTANSCAIKRESNSTKHPLDVFFSIDVSTSMTFTLEAVKLGVISFSENLSAKGYDVRFAASGFVDRPNRYVIPFTGAREFQTQISDWTVLDDNNEDTQEGGQENLEEAVKTILSESRAGAVKVLIHVSDALAFAKGDHNNFETDQLARFFVASKDKLGTFMFFDSVPQKDFLSSLFGMGESSQSPAAQMKEFRSQAQLPGIQLDFPFTAETLTDQELPNLIVSTESQTVVCK